MIEQILEAAVEAAQKSRSGKAPVIVNFNGTHHDAALGRGRGVVMADPDPFTLLVTLKGSAAAELVDGFGAELAAGVIACICPHPATADRLYLPSRTLLCHDCSAEADDRPDSVPGPCTGCGAPGACSWSGWVDKPTRVLVIARVCQACGTDGTVPLSWN